MQRALPWVLGFLWLGCEEAQVRSTGPVARCGEGAQATEPPRQLVQFRFAPRDRGFLVVEGAGCYPVHIERLGEGGAAAPLALYDEPSACGGVDSGVVSFPRLALPFATTAGPSYQWDAREMRACEITLPCPYFVNGEPRARLGRAYTRHPVAPGRYRATFGVVFSPHASCATNSQGQLQCRSGNGTQNAVACQTESTLSVEFTLPASGDVDVFVPADTPTTGDAGAADAEARAD